MGFRFQDPLWLLLLIPLAAAGLWMLRRRRRTAVLYSSVELLKKLPVTWAQQVKRLLPWIFIAGLALFIVALARPQHGKEEFRIRAEGIAIEMVVDRSGSMQAMDFELDNKRANRLAVVKKVFKDFVTGEGGSGGRPDDLIGLVDFGGFVEAKCPLTFDHGALLQLLDTVKIPQPITDSQGNIINARLLQEEQMTAIGDALATGRRAVETHQGQKQNHHPIKRRRKQRRRGRSGRGGRGGQSIRNKNLYHRHRHDRHGSHAAGRRRVRPSGFRTGTGPARRTNPENDRRRHRRQILQRPRYPNTAKYLRRNR